MSNEEQLGKGKESIELEKKLSRKYGNGFVSEIRGLDKAGLENKLLGLANHNQEVITTKNNDRELEVAKDKKNELEAPYRDQIAANKIKTRFIHLILKEKDVDGGHYDNAEITLTSEEQDESRLS